MLRWAIIGTGRFGRIHAEVVASLPDVELVALCNRSEQSLGEAAAQFDVPNTYTDYRRLLDEAEVDVVDVVTHWQDHFQIAHDALAAGKHVLLEKPMAPTAAQCSQLVEAARQASGQFMVGHVCRFDPRYTLARQAVAEGRIGRVVSMHARRNLRRAPGRLRLDKISPLMGDGVHDADLMMWFADAVPTSVWGRNVRVHDYTYPDLGWAMLHFGEEAVGVVETVWCLPENTPYTIDARLEVIGSEGALYVDCGNAGLEVHDAQGSQLPDTAYWPRQHGHAVGALRREIEYFADCVRRGEEPTVMTPEESARAVAVIEAAETSAATGRAVELSAE